MTSNLRRFVPLALAAILLILAAIPVGTTLASSAQRPVDAAAAAYACPTTSTRTYSQGIMYQYDGDNPVRPAYNHADKNLALRSYSLTTGTKGLVTYGSDDPVQPPQFATLFSPDRTPVFSNVYRVYNWAWQPSPNPGTRGSAITTPAVTALGMSTYPGEPIEAPTHGRDVGSPWGPGGWAVIYADADSVTLHGTREDSAARGYTLHIDGICTDPNLVAHYNQLDNAARNTFSSSRPYGYDLVGLKKGQVLGTARGTEVVIALADTGTFQDPRSKLEWWQINPGLPAATPTPITPTATPNLDPLGAGYYEDSDSRITYTGVWAYYVKAEASGGGYMRTADRYGRASFSFTGYRLTIYRTLASNRGAMDVCIDGACQRVNNYSSTTVVTQPVIYNVSAGTHTVEIRNTSTSYIDLDAVRVEGGTSPATNTPTPTKTPTPTNTPVTPTATNTPGSTGGALGAGYYEDSASAITYTGAWAYYVKVEASGGGYMRTADRYARASFSFTGTKLTIYRTLAINRGAMDVCIDGACQRVQNYNATTVVTQPVVFNVSAGTHTVEIRNTSTNYIDLDAVRVESSTSAPTATPTATNTPGSTGGALGAGYYEDSASAITYTGAWAYYVKVEASGGGYMRTSDRYARASFSFTGTKLTIYRTLAINRGAMDVCIDGVCQRVNNYSSTTIVTQPVVYNVSAGTHTVEIRNTSTNYIDLDALRVE